MSSAVPGSSKDLSRPKQSEPESNSEEQPQKPGTSNNDQDSFDDPKPGPSTTAAEFDLEVFDSGSSCSLEDCWSCKDPPIKKKLNSGASSENEAEFSNKIMDKMSEMESACPSETEEAISDDDEEEDDDKMNEEDDEDHCQCPKSLIALPPLRLSEVNCWKCAGPSTSTASLTLCQTHAEENSTENIDEIVQDHDNFGTDENEEDSLDSSLMMDISETKLPKKIGLGGQKRKSENEDKTETFKNRSESDLPLIIPKRKRENSVFSNCEAEQEICLKFSTCSAGNEMKRLDNNSEEVNDVEIENIEPLIPLEPPKDLEPWLDSFSSWSHAQRLCAIDLLINRCHPTQVRHMMAVIEPQFQRDFISLLPKELALYVLSFLHPRDLLRAAQTCRYWRILAEDNLLWREKCREAGLDDSTDLLHFRNKQRINFRYSPWKASFMRQHNIEINWRVKGIRTPKVLKGHDDHVITCLQFSNNRIVSGSDDNTLKVWNATTGKCMRTLAGHTGGVWSSQMQGNIIVSGSTDRTLKIWNADSGSCLHTLHGHTSTVRCMHLHDQRVVSGSRDATLRMWDIGSGQCLHVLVGHVAAVRCVQYDGRLVVSGAYDYMVKVWNPETEECLHTLSGHTNRVYSLQFDGIHVVSGSLDTSIRVWDVETGACKHALMGHQSLTSGMELRNNILVSGNADSTVKVWDITTGQCLQTLSGPNKHQSAVTCLQFNSKFVITSSDDGTVKLWDVKTGDFIRDLVALESGGSGGVVWRIRANATKLVCAVGSRNGTEETKLLVLDFDVHDSK